jgi:hypothetical protein
MEKAKICIIRVKTSSPETDTVSLIDANTLQPACEGRLQEGVLAES